MIYAGNNYSIQVQETVPDNFSITIIGAFTISVDVTRDELQSLHDTITDALAPRESGLVEPLPDTNVKILSMGTT